MVLVEVGSVRCVEVVRAGASGSERGTCARVGGCASGGRGARRSDPATMMCAGSAAAKVPAAMMWRELLSGCVPDSNQAGGGARRVRTKHTPWWLGRGGGGGAWGRPPPPRLSSGMCSSRVL